MHTLNSAASLDPVLNEMKDKKVVMLGEASHGTHEYYVWRSEISKRLIREYGFRFIAVEGDWPDCYLLNRYVKSLKEEGGNALQAFQSFDRWPTWMWSNWEIAALLEWLREYNRTLSSTEKVGFYGLDVYSLWDSMKVIMDYLQKEDKAAAAAVKNAIGCFEPFGENEQLYARASLKGHRCHEEVIALLRMVRSKAQYLDGDREAGLNAEQNARIAVNAEKYYRSMTAFDNQSWNIRDRHMMETLDQLIRFHGISSNAIVWEHNTHIGDARATDMAGSGMVNIGQLAREEYGHDNVYLAGFASYEGSVIAGEAWGAAMEEMVMPPAKKESIESLLHNDFGGAGYFLFSEETNPVFLKKIPHRAIGVVYHPSRDKYANYVPSVLAGRYNALFYLDQTTALHPFFRSSKDENIPETFAFGI